MTDYQAIHDDGFKSGEALGYQHGYRDGALNAQCYECDSKGEYGKTLIELVGRQDKLQKECDSLDTRFCFLRNKLENDSEGLSNGLSRLVESLDMREVRLEQRLKALEERTEEDWRSIIKGWLESMQKDNELLGHTCELGKRVKTLEGRTEVSENRISRLTDSLLDVREKLVEHRYKALEDAAEQLDIPRPDLSEENE